MLEMMGMYLKVVAGGWMVGLCILGVIMVCCGIGTAADSYSKRSKK